MKRNFIIGRRSQYYMKSGQQKMKKLLFRIILFLILMCNLYPLQSVGQQVRIFNSNNSGLPSNDITAMAIDTQGNKWFGTENGEVVKFDDTNWTVYNQSNSALSGNYIRSIAIDAQNNIWIATTVYHNFYVRSELVKFDNADWTVYNNLNSGLPHAYIADIAIDASGNKWIGTGGGGIVKFDDTNWTIYNSASTGLSLDYIDFVEIDRVGNVWVNYGMKLFKFDASQWTSFDIPESEYWPWDLTFNFMVIDAEGNKWMGTTEDSDLHGRVIKFDNESWYDYNNNNSPALPRQFPRSCVFDEQGNKWFGMSDWWNNEALVKFDGSNWTVYNTENLDLPNMSISKMVIDKKGTIWLGTGNGVVEFSDYQIKTGLNNDISVNSNDFKVYPNPAKNQITIEGLESGTIGIYNSAGAVLKNSEIHGIITNVDISHLPDGIYFIRAVTSNDAVTKIFIKGE